MKLIVGLGNPGEKYEKTRHNIGFAVVEQFLKDFQPVGKTTWTDEKKFKSDEAEIEWKPKHGDLEKIFLVKPKTYMNNAGMAVSLFTSFYKIDPADVWIVYDEIDLPLGAMKIRFGGAAAGHHGVESIMEKLGTDAFWRFRMGVGHPKRMVDGKSRISNKRDVDGFVLGEFGEGERGKVRELIKRGAKAMEMSLEKSLEAAMNRFNTK